MQGGVQVLLPARDAMEFRLSEFGSWGKKIVQCLALSYLLRYLSESRRGQPVLRLLPTLILVLSETDGALARFSTSPKSRVSCQERANRHRSLVTLSLYVSSRTAWPSPYSGAVTF